MEGLITHGIDGTLSSMEVYSGHWLSSFYDIDTSTVGQYTGLKDKNGKRIFEGDICKIHNLVYKVEFKYSEWVFTILSKTGYCYPVFNSHCGEYCEVIGNIYDNPELLKGGGE